MHSDEEFLRIIERTPLVSIDLICRNPAREVLLGKRNNRPAQGYWFVPGGRILKGETLAAAITRISGAELGLELNLSKAKLLGVYEHMYTDNYLGTQGIGTHYVVLAHCFELGNEPIKADDQHATMRWWTVDSLLHSEEVHPNTQAYFLATT